MIEIHVKQKNSIEIKFNEKAEEITKRLQSTQTIFQLSNDFTNYLIQRFLTGGTTATRLRVRSGHLRRSTRPFGVKVNDKVVFGAKIGVNYASTHIGKGETIIKPRKAKYLAIPLPAAQTPAGVSRYASPRDIEGQTFIAKHVIFRRDGNTITPMFALKKEVRVPKRIDPDFVFDKYSKRLIRKLEYILQGL